MRCEDDAHHASSIDGHCFGLIERASDPVGDSSLALTETKPNALDPAAALQGWELPEVSQHLRHLLEARVESRSMLRRRLEFVVLIKMRARPILPGVWDILR
jgi:hypothetical protein